MAIGSVLDPYTALGVAHDASPATVRSSYKKLMLQCHPDKVRGDETQRAEKAQQFQKVQEAYELLIDSRRRRKYDEELAKNRHHGTAAAQAAATAAAAPTSAPAAAGTATPSGPQTNGKSPPAPPPPPPTEDGPKQKDRERHERHERRRRREDDRRTREEWNETEREPGSYRARYKSAEPEETARSSGHHERDRYKDDIPKTSSRHPYGSSSTSRYTTDDPSPRKSSYERTPPSHVPPHAPPPPAPEPRVTPAPPSEAETVRPGYEETRAAEEKKLEAVRRRLREAQGLSTPSPRTTRSNSHEEDPTGPAKAAADYLRQQHPADQMRRELEREKERQDRRERKQRQKEAQHEHLSERLGRPTDIPSSRSSRKVSCSPLGRRGSSTASKDDYGTTPPMKPMGPMGPMNPMASMNPMMAPMNPMGPSGLFTGSVPTGGFYAGSPHASAPYPQMRRRHSVSSPSLEKQTSRLQRDQTCDSGYSSPSPNDTPMTFEKKHIPSKLNPNPTVRNADGSTIHPRDPLCNSNGNPHWKQYTFKLFVREDGEANSPLPNGSSAGSTRRKSSSAGTGSPGSQSAEPIISEGPPLLPDFLAQAAGISPGSQFYVGGVSVDHRNFPASPGYSTSHTGTSHSSHSSPRAPQVRHSSVHGHHHSPKMSSDAFFGAGGMPSPGMSRASMYTASTRRTEVPQVHLPPSFPRTGTWG